MLAHLISRSNKYIGCISILLVAWLCFAPLVQATGQFVVFDPQPGFQTSGQSQDDVQVLDDRALDGIAGRYAAPPTANGNGDIAVILWDEPGRGGNPTKYSSAIGEGNLQNNITVVNGH